MKIKSIDARILDAEESEYKCDDYGYVTEKGAKYLKCNYLEKEIREERSYYL